MKIKWLFFDIGSTLVDEEACFRKRCKIHASSEQCKALRLDEEALYNEIIEASKIYQNQYKYVVKKYNLSPYVEHDVTLETLYPDTVKTLKALKQKYHLGIIANQLPGLKDRLKLLGLDQYFEVVIGSNDVGIHKPDLEIYRLGLKEANAKIEESIMIGDRLDNDVYPAKKLGMKTIWIKKGFGKYQTPLNQEYEPDYIINNLEELITVLQ